MRYGTCCISCSDERCVAWLLPILLSLEHSKLVVTPLQSNIHSPDDVLFASRAL